MQRTLGALTLGLALALPATAVADDVHEFGISPQATYNLVQEDGDDILFIDVRDPVEIMFVGFTDEVDLNIPFLLVDRHDWDDEKNRFNPSRNPDFVDQIDAALEERGLNRDATIITMCRSGSERGEPSAAFLRENGFPNARYVVNGFQGDAISEGERAGFRLKNGWQNSGLPWSREMNADKIHRSD
ncbi:rhodanese-like domain-containing protein [Thioalkalivibrio sp. ALE11]|uniref:rhodanese-like domain-containing protein n=1 Tax=Thioalkalivibrio sp. ALE11 TaxID=1265494 RepID=UPI00036D3D2A|nr:rhodanese-like domain-containing protein [Thioalkalivibrio sp. ALE11]